MLKEHLKQDKLWEYIKQWRKAMLDHIWARWQFKLSIKREITKQIDQTSLTYRDNKQYGELIREIVTLLYSVTSLNILGTRNTTISHRKNTDG